MTPRRARPAVEMLEDRLVPTADAVMAWNDVLLDANAADHALAAPDQGGPTLTSRAFAIVSAAVFDAVNSISHNYDPFLTELPGYETADVEAAVSAAAYYTLAELYPQQQASFDTEFANWQTMVPDGAAEDAGLELGQLVAQAILNARAGDGSDAMMMYTPKNLPGFHRPDPLNPAQPFLTPQWGEVDTFVIGDVNDFQADPPPALQSPAYTAAYYQVLLYGGDGVTTPTLRTPEQTEIGLYWAYDGTPGLGTPPRLYNQIVQVIAKQEGNSLEENARLLALVNLAMADAGIQCWDAKYDYEFWRPIVGIREGNADTNPLTIGLPNWSPLGAPFSNGGPGAINFTPPFPAYGSGHATFGAATFQAIANFYGTDDISFDFISDELNGVTRDVNGNVRPAATRHFDSLSAATWENALSRIYLGIHWIFDATSGIKGGTEIANFVTSNALRPRDEVLTFNAGAQAADIVVSIDAQAAQIINRLTGEVLASRSASGLSGIVINGSNTRADRIEISVSPDAPALADSVRISGGASRNDQVLVNVQHGRDTVSVNGNTIQLNAVSIELDGVEKVHVVSNWTGGHGESQHGGSPALANYLSWYLSWDEGQDLLGLGGTGSRQRRSRS